MSRQSTQKKNPATNSRGTGKSNNSGNGKSKGTGGPKGSGSSSSGTSNKRKKQTQDRSHEISEKENNEPLGLVLLAMGIISALSIYFESQIIGQFGVFLSNIVRGIFGVTAVFIPIALIAFGITEMFFNRMAVFKGKLISGFVLLVLFSIIIQTGVYELSNLNGFLEYKNLVNYFIESQTTLSGGVLGVVLSLPFVLLFHKVGAMIIFVTIALIIAMDITDISLAHIIRSILRKLLVKTGPYKVRNAHIAEAATAYAENVPMTGMVNRGRVLREHQEEVLPSRNSRCVDFQLEDKNGKVTKKHKKDSHTTSEMDAFGDFGSFVEEVNATAENSTIEINTKSAEQIKMEQLKRAMPWRNEDLGESSESAHSRDGSKEHVRNQNRDQNKEQNRDHSKYLDREQHGNQGGDNLKDKNGFEHAESKNQSIAINSVSAYEGIEDLSEYEMQRAAVPAIELTEKKGHEHNIQMYDFRPTEGNTDGISKRGDKSVSHHTGAVNSHGSTQGNVCPGQSNTTNKTGEDKGAVDAKDIESEIHQEELPQIQYAIPPFDLLKGSGGAGAISARDLKNSAVEGAKRLETTLKSFGVDAKIINISVGPALTRYEVQPSPGVKVSKIVNLSDDIALNLAASGVRVAPIPGKVAIGIEVPNKEVAPIGLREVLETPDFMKFDSRLAVGLGKDVSGENMIIDIAKMPHLLIAGATGSGKSVCINSLIISILYKASPDEVKLLMVDPKVVELGVYNGIPHLLIPVVTDARKAAGALNWAVQEMIERYKNFADRGVRDLTGYNNLLRENNEPGVLPHVVIIIDELADLMMVAPHDVEDAICRLAQMARAAGMHLVIATQRPSVNVITGVIKANIPSRIAFAVSSQVDSRTILDMGGAEKLVGKGDMLYYPVGAPKPIRAKGAFVSDKEVEKIVEFIKTQGRAQYNEDIIENIAENQPQEAENNNSGMDEMLSQAIDSVVEAGQASVSFIQRKFKVGYARAGRMIDQMEERGIISGYEGSKPRNVLITRQDWEEMKMRSGE